MSAPELISGYVVAGKYVIRSLLLHGGATATYRAVAPKNREIAIKLYDPAILSFPDVLKTLALHRSIGAKMSPHQVVPIAETGTDSNSGAPFTVSDFDSGPSLAQLIDGGPLSVGEMLALVRNVARTTDLLHSNGIASLSLHPGNVFVRPSAQYEVRIADFGASLIRTALPVPEKSGRWMPWLAPEQIKGQTPAHAADVFALALLAFFAVTGKPYWRSAQAKVKDMAALRREILGERMPASVRAGEFSFTLNPVVDTVFARALAFRPADRYSTAREFAAGLEAVLSGRSVAEADVCGDDQDITLARPAIGAEPAAQRASSPGEAAPSTGRMAAPPPRKMALRTTMLGMGSPSAQQPTDPSAMAPGPRPQLTTMLGIGEPSAEVSAPAPAKAVASPAATAPVNASPPAMPTQHAQASPPVMPTQQAKASSPVMPTQQAKASSPVMPTQQAKASPPVMPTQQAKASPPVMPTQQAKASPPVMPTQQAKASPPAMPTAPNSPPTAAQPQVLASPVVAVAAAQPAVPATPVATALSPAPVMPVAPATSAASPVVVTPAKTAEPGEPQPLPIAPPPDQLEEVLARFEAAPTERLLKTASPASSVAGTDIAQTPPAWSTAEHGDASRERVETGVAVIGADFAETPKKSRLRWIASVCGLLVLTGGGAVALSGGTSGSRGRTASDAKATTIEPAAPAAIEPAAPAAIEPAAPAVIEPAAPAAAVPAPAEPAIEEPQAKEPAAPAAAPPPTAEPAAPVVATNAAAQPEIVPSRSVTRPSSPPHASHAAPATPPAQPSKKPCGKFLKRCD